MAIAKLDNGTKWAVKFTENGTWYPIYIPAPNIVIEHTNIASADSGRTEDGYMHINWVRRDVRKVNLVYNAISGNEKHYMEYEIGDIGMQGHEFWFRYQDGKTVNTGTEQEPVWTKNVVEFYGYVGESKYQYYSSVHRPEEGGIYTNYTINVIEF